MTDKKQRRRRKPNKDVGGRPITPTICPTCGLLDSYGRIYHHVSRCPGNEPMRISVDEWRKDLAERQYVCPVGCGEQHVYRDMLRHIPKCPKQSEIFPYTKARWLKELTDTRSQPGTKIAQEALSHKDGATAALTETATEAA